MPNGGQSPLEIAAIAARNALLPKNTYNNAAPANEYTATHTRAIGSGRNPAFALNLGTFGFDPTHRYVAPNTSKNIGQVII